MQSNTTQALTAKLNQHLSVNKIEDYNLHEGMIYSSAVELGCIRLHRWRCAVVSYTCLLMTLTVLLEHQVLISTDNL